MQQRDAQDRAAIDELVRRFFTCFCNKGGAVPQLDVLYALCIPQAVIVSCASGEPKAMGLAAFIAPREVLLTGGTLTDFSEAEVCGETRLFGDMAQRLCVYEKSGSLRGEPFVGRGVKSLQFVRTAAGWRISATVWDDERELLAIDMDALFGRGA